MSFLLTNDNHLISGEGDMFFVLDHHALSITKRQPPYFGGNDMFFVQLARLILNVGGEIVWLYEEKMT